MLPVNRLTTRSGKKSKDTVRLIKMKHIDLKSMEYRQSNSNREMYGTQVYLQKQEKPQIKIVTLCTWELKKNKSPK